MLDKQKDKKNTFMILKNFLINAYKNKVKIHCVGYHKLELCLYSRQNRATCLKVKQKPTHGQNISLM